LRKTLQIATESLIICCFQFLFQFQFPVPVPEFQFQFQFLFPVPVLEFQKESSDLVTLSGGRAE
jgi:hypothetical protein